MRLHQYTALLLISQSGFAISAEDVHLKTEADRINYSLGYQVGADFKRQGVELEKDAVKLGIEDAQSGYMPLLSTEAMNSMLGQLKGKILGSQKSESIKRYEKRKAEAERKRAEGKAFLAENGQKPGVKTLPSGLQYRVVKPGKGKKPGPQDRVSVNYRSTLINGHEFDSSYRRKAPESFRVNGVIAGWTEALQLMSEGAVWELFIPPDLGYGKRGPLADQTLIFEVELLQVVDSSQAQQGQPAPKQTP